VRQAWGEEVHGWFGEKKTPKKMDHLKDLVVDGKFVFKWILEEYVPSTWPGLIRLRIGSSAELL
jgi:hypothetical protein